MKTFLELRQDVYYMGRQGMGVLPVGRIAVLDGAYDREARSFPVITVGRGGDVIKVRVPRESATILGECRAKTLAPTDVIYVGEHSAGEYHVTGWPVDKHGNLCGQPYVVIAPQRHSLGGMAWGYEGDGPADLALALLRDMVGAIDADEESREALVEAYYRDFRDAFVSRQPERGRWSTTRTDLLQRLRGLVNRAKIAKARTA